MSNDQEPPQDSDFVAVTSDPGLDSREPSARASTTNAARKRKRTWLPPLAANKTSAAGVGPDAVASHAVGLGTPAHDKAAVFITGNGGETIPAEPDLHPFQRIIRQSPELLAAQATEVRLRQTSMVSNDALILAVEATQSNAASTAMERDIMHHYAALHCVGMDLIKVGNQFMATITPWQTEERQQLHSIEATRCIVAATKALRAAQGAVQTLKYLRDGGRQTVTVQHVTVEAGGQAVVAGAVKPRRRKS